MEAIAGTDVFRLFAAPVTVVNVTDTRRGDVDETLRGLAGDGAPADGGLQRDAALAPLLALFEGQAREVLAARHVQHGVLEVVQAGVERGHVAAERAFRGIGNAYLAGVYVVDAPAGGCALEFEDPRPQAAVLTLPGAASDGRDRVTLAAGHLAVFPAWLRHRIAAAGEDGPFLALRVGLMFRDFAATMSAPVWKGST